MAIGVAVLALFVAAVEVTAPRIWKYRVDSEGVALLCLGRSRWWRIRHEDIAAVEVVSFLDTLLDESLRGFGALMVANKPLARLRVVVRHRNGRAYVLTPPDAHGFVRAVNERIAWPEAAWQATGPHEMPLA